MERYHIGGVLSFITQRRDSNPQHAKHGDYAPKGNGLPLVYTIASVGYTQKYVKYYNIILFNKYTTVKCCVYCLAVFVVSCNFYRCITTLDKSRKRT